MKASSAVSSISPGSILLALAKRASRDRPICARFSESMAINSVQAGLSGVFDFRSTGLKPLAFTAARKSERMLAKLFAVKPAAIGLTAASLDATAGRSSRMTDGSSRSNAATRLTADRRSRSRVGERSLRVSNAARTLGERDVWGSGAPRSSTSKPARSGHVRLAFREAGIWSREVSGGLGVTDEDIRVFYHKVDGTSVYT